MWGSSMPHRVDRMPRYETEFIDSYTGPTGELLHDLTTDELVLQNNQRGGVRLAKKTDLSALEALVGQLVTSGTGIFNVANFGAVGDGKTDDTAAIQAAINAAGDAGGGVVFMPSGVYLQTANIQLRNRVSIVGLGYVELKRASHNWGIMFELTIPLDAPAGDNLYQGLSDIIIRNIKFNCNGVAIDRPYNEGGCEAIAMGLSKNILVDNCEFWNRVGTHTIEVSGSKNILIRNCKFYGGYEHVESNITPPGEREHIQIEYSTGGAVVTKSHISTSYAHSENVTVESCVFGPSADLPTGAACVGCHNAIEDDFSAVNVNIIDCQFVAPEKWAINWYVSKDYVVEGCTFLQCPMAIRATCVRNNVDRNGVPYGHGKAPDGLLFVNNWVEGESDGYLYYTRTDNPDEPDVRIRNVIIANNIFVKKNGGHIALRFHYDPIITNNVFRGDCKLILSVLRSSCLFKDNYCNGYTQNGVYSGEKNIEETAGISRNVVIEGNMFVGNHAEEHGRAINLEGNGGNTGVSILNNVVRSVYNGNDFSEPFNVNSWDYVSVHGNTVYRVNGFPSNRPWMVGFSTIRHASIGTNTLLPLPTNPNGFLAGAGGRSEQDTAVTGNIMLRSSGQNATALRIYGGSFGNDCLAVGAVRIPGAEARLGFGTEDMADGTRKYICEVGYDYTDTDPYVRPTGTDTRVNLGTPEHPWRNLYVVNPPVTGSDERMKEDVANLPAELLDVWENIEYKEFLWKNRSQRIDDIDRYHSGVIAQQVRDVLTEHGLAPERFGFFCQDGERYGIRYTELLVVEVAYLRREIQKLKEKLELSHG